MKILDIKEQEDGGAIIDVDLTDTEEVIAYATGIYLVPEETDREKVIEQALLYYIVVGMIQESEIGKND